MLNTVSITNLKQNTSDVVKNVKITGKPVVIMQRSEPAAVLMDPAYFGILEQTLEDLEDLEDLQIIEERKNEPTVPFEKYFKKRFSKIPAPAK